MNSLANNRELISSSLAILNTGKEFLRSNSYARNTIIIVANLALFYFTVQEITEFTSDKLKQLNIANSKAAPFIIKVVGVALPVMTTLAAVALLHVPITFGYATALSLYKS